MPQNRVQQVIRALNSPIRREILWRVWDRELAVADIADGLSITAPTLSGHLAVLREAGLVTLRPDGTTRWYRARQDAVSGFRGFLEDPARWYSGASHPEQRHADGAIEQVVVVTARTPCGPADAFRGFTDARIYGACIGGDVSIEGNQFAANLPFGQIVRGTYLLASPPSLIVMDWDFSFQTVPVPGDGHRAHLLIFPEEAGGSRMEINQFVASSEQRPYMETAWRYVLGCFSERLSEALSAP